MKLNGLEGFSERNRFNLTPLQKQSSSQAFQQTGSAQFETLLTATLTNCGLWEFVSGIMRQL